jgi:hypothetical protein
LTATPISSVHQPDGLSQSFASVSDYCPQSQCGSLQSPDRNLPVVWLSFSSNVSPSCCRYISNISEIYF